MQKAIYILIILALLGGGWYYLAGPGAAQHNADGEDNGGEVCAQVLTDARNPETNEVETFPTPCDVPEGWDVLESDPETFDRDGETFSRYRNDDLGLRFEYRTEPDGYLLVDQSMQEVPSEELVEFVSLFNEEEYREVFASDVPREGPPGITFMVFGNPEGYTAREWVEENQMMSNYRPDGGLPSTELEEIEFSGNPAVRYTYDGLYTNDTIVAHNNGRIYFISGSYFDEESDIRQDFLEMLEHIQLY